MDSAAIRRSFVEHFVERGHLEVPSASLVPATLDPSVLLTTAGMQPFKPYFLGQRDAAGAAADVGARSASARSTSTRSARPPATSRSSR